MFRCVPGLTKYALGRVNDRRSGWGDNNNHDTSTMTMHSHVNEAASAYFCGRLAKRAIDKHSPAMVPAGG